MAKKAAAAAENTATVQVEALEDHTCLGKSYECGDTYAAPADLVETLEVQGKVMRAEDGAGKRARMKAKPKKAGKSTYKTRALKAKR